jgi:putative FmdB family regulatory protein
VAGSAHPDTIDSVPIYEFQCAECGARFEQLVDAGTPSAGCPSCGTEGARRVYSAPGAPLNLVKTPAATRRQERKNAQLREATKRRFKEARARQRGGGAK